VFFGIRHSRREDTRGPGRDGESRKQSLIVIEIEVPINPINFPTRCISHANPEYVTIFLSNDISASVAKKKLKI
jgi:hypothetical protein